MIWLLNIMFNLRLFFNLRELVFENNITRSSNKNNIRHLTLCWLLSNFIHQTYIR